MIKKVLFCLLLSVTLQSVAMENGQPAWFKDERLMHCLTQVPAMAWSHTKFAAMMEDPEEYTSRNVAAVFCMLISAGFEIGSVATTRQSCPCTMPLQACIAFAYQPAQKKNPEPKKMQ